MESSNKIRNESMKRKRRIKFDENNEEKNKNIKSCNPSTSFESITSKAMLYNNNTHHNHHQQHYLQQQRQQRQQVQQDEFYERCVIYMRAERAALKIQQNFRENKAKREQEQQQQQQQHNSNSMTTNTTVSDNEEDGDTNNNKEATKLDDDFWSRCAGACMYSLYNILIPIIALFRCLSFLLPKDNNNVADDIDVVAVNTTTPGGGGGGGGGGPAPGAETAGAQGTAAASGGAQGAATTAIQSAAIQAAGSAASAASSGLAGAASAAAAASGATAGFAATVAAASTTQIVTAVAVTAAAVAATTTVVYTAPAVTNIVTTCGLVNPEVHVGRFALSFEGFDRELIDREVTLIENLVVESYNNITRGEYFFDGGGGNIGCVDPFLREMQSATIINQTIQQDSNNETAPTTLETIIEAKVGCSKCPRSQPLFGGLDEEQRYLRQLNGDDDDLGIRFDRNLFFQAVIGLIITGTDDFTDVGEIEMEFSTISRALVITADEEEVMVTNIRYIQSHGDVDNNDSDVVDSSSQGKIVFTYQEDEKEVTTTIEITIDGQVQITSSCGVDEWEFYEESFQLSFQGFAGLYPEDPSSLLFLEETILESYNSLTVGTVGDVTSYCQDPTLRAIQSVTLVEQALENSSDGEMTLVLTLRVFITCLGCSRTSPLFGPNENNGDDSSALVGASLMVSFVQVLITGLSETSDENESSSSVVVPPGYSFPTAVDMQLLLPDGETLSSEYQIHIEMEYSSNNGDGGGSNSIEFSTYEPSTMPSLVPSLSTQPSTIPSERPSLSISPSSVPSFVPSDVPSTAPSVVPSTLPSFVPSDVPSFVPSAVPSMIPSTVPSDTPSMVPSLVPSDVPSDIPSDVPSDIPSDVPSDTPSDVPSDTPSDMPSDVPSDMPSDVPSDTPSDAPSFVPSVAPSDAPSFMPSAVVSLITGSASASQSSTFELGSADKAIDGNTNGDWSANSVTHTRGGICHGFPGGTDAGGTPDPWWKVDLGFLATVKRVKIFNRNDCDYCALRLKGAKIELLDNNMNIVQDAEISIGGTIRPDIEEFYFGAVSGIRTVRVKIYGCGILQIAELQVYGYQE